MQSKNKVSKKTKNGFSHSKKLMLFFLGGIVGFINGFFGGGGGTVGVPILEKWLHVDNKIAHATCLALILPLSVVSSAVYVYFNVVDNNLLVSIGVGVIFGGILGSFLLKILPSKIVRIIFSIVLLVGGLRLILW